jgi:hypothetical protein
MNSTIHVSVLLKCNLKKVYSFDVGSLGDVPVISDIVCFNDGRGEVFGSVIQRVVDYASSHVFLIIQSMPEKWLGRYANLVERYCSRTFEKAFAASEKFLADVPDASVLMLYKHYDFYDIEGNSFLRILLASHFAVAEEKKHKQINGKI